MDDKLEIISKIKKSILYIDKLLENYHRNEYILRDRTKNELYDLLKDTYLANLDEGDRKNKQREILAHIKMLDFYLNTAYKKELISSKQYTNIGKHLLEIFKMVKGWIMSTKV